MARPSRPVNVFRLRLSLQLLSLSSLVLLLTWTGVASAACPASFNGRCSCGMANYDSRQQYVVNCTNEGFRDTKVLEKLPDQTEVLIFTGNYITELPWNVLGTMNDWKALKIVDMSNNHIREIRGKSYHHVANVQRLILNHNNISISRDDYEPEQSNAAYSVNRHHPRVFSNFINLMELHLTNAFADNTSAALSEDLHDIFVNSNLTKLIKLHLEQNEIAKFKDKRVFCDLPSLRDLHLGDNLLRELNFNVLCLKNLRFLDLERNVFESVKQKDLTLLDALQDLSGRTVNLIVDFTYNPFRCDCSVYPLVAWMNSTRVTVRNGEHYTCHRNGKVFERLAEINVNRCRVPSKASKTSTGHRITLVFLLIVLSFVLIGLIMALVYISKSRMKHLLTPVLENVSKKVQYTSIKDEDVPEVHV